MNKYNNSQEYADKMEQKAKPFFKFFGFGILIITIIIGVGFGFKFLWNWIMPDVFGLKEVTFWKAIGIFFLAKLIFGGFGSSSSSNKAREKAAINEITSHIGESLHKEMQEAFKKDYAKKFGETYATSEPSYGSNLQGASTKEEPFNNVEDQDALYEKWWEEEGEAYFEKFLKDHLES